MIVYKGSCSIVMKLRFERHYDFKLKAIDTLRETFLVSKHQWLNYRKCLNFKYIANRFLTVKSMCFATRNISMFVFIISLPRTYQVIYFALLLNLHIKV